MKTSIAIATFLVAGISAAGVAALPNPYFGSDTLFDITQQAILNDDTGANANTTYFSPGTGNTVKAFYVGGGSGGGATAMSAAAPKQLAAPMSRMMKSEGNICAGTPAGSNATNSSGIVIGLDGVDIYASNTSTNTQLVCTVPAGTAFCQTASNSATVGTTCGGTGTCVQNTTAGSGTCNGTADNSGTGLVYSGQNGVFHAGAAVGVNSAQTWKWALALLYGGNDFSQPGGGPNAVPDCSQASRQNLVKSWSNLFQGGTCSNGSTICQNTAHLVCSTGTSVGNAQCTAAGAAGGTCDTTGTCVTGALWHAFRRDDTSGTSDVFATILGLAPSTSSSSLSGFGASPYCNAMNWDSGSGNANCGAGPHNQFTGPGGISDPAATAPNTHRKPPPGTYGDNPDQSNAAFAIVASDVLPTQQQDNDPMRRPCLGVGVVSNQLQVGEEVCNLDGQLGLVVPMVDTDWVPAQHPGLLQYPTVVCNAGFVGGTPPSTFKCALNNHPHLGECLNGDAPNGAACQLPVTGTTSQCMNKVSQVPSLINLPLCNSLNQKQCTTTTGFPVPTAKQPGLVFNLNLRDGTVTDGSVTSLQYPIPSLGSGVGLDMVGAFNRIHQMETVLGSAGGAALAAGCQMKDMTDQIACLGQADPCSIGYAGDGGKGFANNVNDPNGFAGAAAVVGAVDSMRIAQVYGQAASVQLLGQKNEYQVSRKLYYNSFQGWTAVKAGLAGDTDEWLLAQYESAGIAGITGDTLTMNQVVVAQNEFTLGNQFAGDGAGQPDPQFCEDFNEAMVCNDVATAAANNPACAGNPAGVPGGAPGAGGVGVLQAKGTSVICGDGVRQAYEECDNGSANNVVAGLAATALPGTASTNGTTTITFSQVHSLPSGTHLVLSGEPANTYVLASAMAESLVGTVTVATGNNGAGQTVNVTHPTGNASEASPGGCSTTCRCTLDYNEQTGLCN